MCLAIMVEYLDLLYKSLTFIQKISVVVLINLILAIISILTKKLTIGASIIAFFMGVIVFYSINIRGFIILLSFFVLCSFATKLSNKSNKITRSSIQVISNGLFATLYSILFFYSNNIEFVVLFSVAIAESTSDTLSSEIGILSKKDPISLISKRKVKKGISGGVTSLGLFSGIIGSFFIAILFYLLFKTTIVYLYIIVVSSFLGNLFDSILGDTIQPLYYDKETNTYTEKEEIDGRETEKIRGARFFDNNLVNLSSNLLSILIAQSLLFLF